MLKLTFNFCLLFARLSLPRIQQSLTVMQGSVNNRKQHVSRLIKLLFVQVSSSIKKGFSLLFSEFVCLFAFLNVRMGCMQMIKGWKSFNGRFWKGVKSFYRGNEKYLFIKIFAVQFVYLCFDVYAKNSCFTVPSGPKVQFSTDLYNIFYFVLSAWLCVLIM